MRHGTSNRRQRGRGNQGGGQGRRGGNNRMQVFDSNGPDVRIRGTAHQVHEKYMTLAKDASSSGDIVLAESYLQHAEHYQRLINEFAQDAPEQKQAPKQDSQKQAQKPQAKEEDLSLPSSILGANPEASYQEKSEKRTVEATA